MPRHVSGTAGSTPFSFAAISITATADTPAIISITNGVEIPVTQANLTINGVGSGTITTPGYIYDNQSTGKLVYGSSADLLSVTNVVFDTYGLSTGLSQTFGLAGQGVITADWSSVATSLGAVTITGVDPDLRNSVTAISPEPSTLISMFAALGILLAFGGRHSRWCR